MAKKKQKYNKDQKVRCPSDCFKCIWQKTCMICVEIKQLKDKLNRSKTEQEKKRIQDLLNILQKYDTWEDLHGKKT